MSTPPAPRPDPETLRRFLLGQLTGPEREAVERYLQAHPEVPSTEDSPADTLIADLRRGRDLPGLDQPELAELTERMKHLSIPTTAEFRSPSSATPTEGGDFSRTDDATDFTDDPLTLLSPPEGPEELGRLAGYRVLRVLGRGGMGVVFEAEEVKLGRRVALKVMAPSLAARSAARDRFLREGRTAATVEHDHIVPIYFVGEDRGVPFIAMPLLRGKALEDRLRDSQPLPIEEVLRVGQEIAAGLAAAHDAGLIHRDVKPSNIWLEANLDGSFKRVRLLDFGLARLTRGDDRLTGSGAVLGTPAYMAPEQARGGEVDHRADLFSLGSVLYHMATGRRPFKGADPFSILTALAVDTPAAPHTVNPAVPASLSLLIMRLLSKDPAGRPASAQEVVAELAKIGLASAPPAAPVAVSPRRRGWGKAVAAVVVTALGLCGVLLFGGTVIRIVTNQGELVIETDDPGIEVVVRQGEAELRDRTKDRRFVLTAGRDGTVEFYDPDTGAKAVTKAFRIERGGKAVVTVTLAEVAATRPPRPTPPISESQPPPRAESPVPPPIELLAPPPFWAEPRRATLANGGRWTIQGNELAQTTLDIAQPIGPVLMFGDPSWTDYDFTCEASAGEGAEGFKFLFRVTDIRNAYGVGYGSYGNTGHDLWQLDKGQWRREHAPGFRFLPGTLERNRWYKVRVSVRGEAIECYLDGQRLFQAKHDQFRQGKLGLSTMGTRVRFRDLKVTAPDGTVLFAGLPELPPPPEPFAPGTTWRGTKSIESGIYAGNTTFYEMRIDRRDGDAFTGRVFDNGPNRNPATVTGTVQGDTITWKEAPLNNPHHHTEIHGTRTGTVLNLTTTGRFPPHWGNKGQARLYRVPRPGEPPPNDFVPIYDGRTLNSWVMHPSQPDGWTVNQYGRLVGSGAAPCHLFTKRDDYADVHVRVRARIESGGDSGVYVRAGFGPTPDGYEAQIAPGITRIGTGGLFVASGKGIPTTRPGPSAGQWFDLDLIAVGQTVRVLVDGQETARAEGLTGPRRGRIALQLSDAKTVVEFVSVAVKELPPSAPEPKK